VAGRPVDLVIRQVSTRFGAVAAVSECTLDVHRGEILALLGPSGCGKTTLLNVIAGFEEPDAGEIWLRGRSLHGVPANRREAGMVFQHYALFPHLTVSGNVGYGLRARGVPRRTADQTVAEVLELLKLTGLEDRYPAALSGGQKQRVAVARALAIRPQLLLLDEALSALDKNLREEMQIELSLLLRRLDVSTILVTHDQREAFALADRIAVMSEGRIVQVGAPADVYRDPRSSFVLEFLGSVNRLPGQMDPAGHRHEVRTACDFVFRPGTAMSVRPGVPLRVYLRAEDIALSRTPTGVHPTTPGRILLVTFLGATTRYVIEVAGHQIFADRPPEHRAAGFSTGDQVFVDFRPEAAHVIPEP
jgi:ABC-type Fe3+/spermidine/putrescine transport system ATPase subunit